MILDHETERFCLVEAWESVDHEANSKIRGSKYKMAYVRPHVHNKQTNIPDFQLCYPWDCLARVARSPIKVILSIAFQSLISSSF